MSPPSPRVGLFVTCLVDAWRPNIGFATVKLLEEAGCRVDIPSHQTCCGQPAYNSGDDATTKALAKSIIDAFIPYDYTVVPSGSCMGMMKYYAELFVDEPEWQQKHAQWLAKSYEILSFLAEVMDFKPPPRRFEGVATYHDSCSGLRQLNIKEQPRRLLSHIAGLTLVEMAQCETCCGFGGTFCIKYPAISNRLVSNKALDIQKTGADTLLCGDLGCLMNMAGKLNRLDAKVRCFHTVEVLAGMAEQPLCEPDAPPNEGPTA